MSFRHTLVTQFIYNEDLLDTNELIGILKNHFDVVMPSYTDRGQLTHIVIRSRDGDNYRVEQQELPAVLNEAQGILKGDLDIVAAWECENPPEPRQRVFTIKGRGERTWLEYIDSKPLVMV